MSLASIQPRPPSSQARISFSSESRPPDDLKRLEASVSSTSSPTVASITDHIQVSKGELQDTISLVVMEAISRSGLADQQHMLMRAMAQSEERILLAVKQTSQDQQQHTMNSLSKIEIDVPPPDLSDINYHFAQMEDKLTEMSQQEESAREQLKDDILLSFRRSVKEDMSVVMEPPNLEPIEQMIAQLSAAEESTRQRLKADIFFGLRQIVKDDVVCALDRQNYELSQRCAVDITPAVEKISQILQGVDIARIERSINQLKDRLKDDVLYGLNQLVKEDVLQAIDRRNYELSQLSAVDLSPVLQKLSELSQRPALDLSPVVQKLSELSRQPDVDLSPVLQKMSEMPASSDFTRVENSITQLKDRLKDLNVVIQPPDLSRIEGMLRQLDASSQAASFERMLSELGLPESLAQIEHRILQLHQFQEPADCTRIEENLRQIIAQEQHARQGFRDECKTLLQQWEDRARHSPDELKKLFDEVSDTLKRSISEDLLAVVDHIEPSNLLRSDDVMEHLKSHQRCLEHHIQEFRDEIKLSVMQSSRVNEARLTDIINKFDSSGVQDLINSYKFGPDCLTTSKIHDSMLSTEGSQENRELLHRIHAELVELRAEVSGQMVARSDCAIPQLHQSRQMLRYSSPPRNAPRQGPPRQTSSDPPHVSSRNAVLRDVVPDCRVRSLTTVKTIPPDALSSISLPVPPFKSDAMSISRGGSISCPTHPTGHMGTQGSTSYSTHPTGHTSSSSSSATVPFAGSAEPRAVSVGSSQQPWWTAYNVMPVGRTAKIAGAEVATFTPRQQDNFGIDEFGNVREPVKFEAALARVRS